MKSLKDRLAHALSVRGHKQQALATAAGVKPPSANGWLSGESVSMKAEPALKAAKFLKVRPWWLIFGEGPMDLDAVATVEAERLDQIEASGVSAWRETALKMAEEWPIATQREVVKIFCAFVDAQIKKDHPQEGAQREKEHTH